MNKFKKRSQKFFCILLSLIMVIGMALPAGADTINLYYNYIYNEVHDYFEWSGIPHGTILCAGDEITVTPREGSDEKHTDVSVKYFATESEAGSADFRDEGVLDESYPYIISLDIDGTTYSAWKVSTNTYSSGCVLTLFVSPVNSHTFAFDLGKVSGKIDAIKDVIVTNNTIGNKMPADPECEGYLFAGWYTDSSLDESKKFDSSSVVSLDNKKTTLYAKWIEVISYIGADGTAQTCEDYTLVTSSETGVTWEAGTYVVADDVTINGGVMLPTSGEVNLILCDGKKLTVTNTDEYAIDYPISSVFNLVFNIFGQSGQNGKLKATGKGGIAVPGALNIYGGDVEAAADFNRGIYSSKSLTIVRGNVKAAGSKGIAASEKIIINGGNVTAVGSTNNAALHGHQGVELGWTKPTDSISLTGKVVTYNGDAVTIAEGKHFTDGNTSLYTGTLPLTQDEENYYANDLADKTLVPAYKAVFHLKTYTGTTDTVVCVPAGTGLVTVPEISVGDMTLDGWYTESDLTGEKYDFTTPVDKDAEFFGRLSKSITYIGADGKPASTDDYTLVTSSDDEVILSAGTYVVADDVTVRRLILTGDLDLILCNDSYLHVNNQIFYQGSNIEGENYTLNVFAQKKTDEESIVGGIGAVNCTVKALNLYGGGISISNKLTAQSFTQKCGFINVSEVMSCPSISLDWSSSDDFFHVKTFGDTTQNINLVKGFTFFDGSVIYSGTLTGEQIEAIADKVLYPAYKVTFKAEDVDDILKGVPATGEATVESLALTNDKNEVAIWYADEQLTEKADFTKPITEDTTFYGKWVPCGIFFDTDGGNDIAPITDVSAKQRIAKPKNPTKEGHTFQYWTLDGRKVTFPYTVPAAYDGTSQIIFKAVWKTNTYKVTFNTNGGSTVKAQTVEYTKTAEKPTAPTRKNFDFVEWQLNGTAYDFDTPVTADITLDAVWNGAEYTVTYMVDGEKFCEETFEYGDIVYSDSSAVLSAMMTDKTAVDGWYTAANLRTKYSPKAITGDLTLYGKKITEDKRSNYDVLLCNNAAEGTGCIAFTNLAEAVKAIGKTYVLTPSTNEDAAYCLRLTKPSVVSTSAITIPAVELPVIIDGSDCSLDLLGVSTIKTGSALTLNTVVRSFNKARTNYVALTIEAAKDLTLSKAITAKSITLKGKKDSTLNINETNVFESITGFGTICSNNASVIITKTVSADNYSDKISLNSGATMTINGSFRGDLSVSSGAKPIVIGKNFDIGNSSIKLYKVNTNENFDGQQIFTLPTTWTEEQVNAFFGKVDISGITSGGDAYETKLYNNKGKVTLEAYKFKLEVEYTGNGDVTETYAFWADAIKRIDEIGTGSATITLLGETTLTKMEMPKLPNFTIEGEKLTLVGITTISPSGIFEIHTPVTCTDKKGNPSALTINVRKDGTLIVHSEISCKSLTIKGTKTSGVAFMADNHADSITGIGNAFVNSKLTVNKTLTADYLNIPEDCELIVKSGAAVTINETVDSALEEKKGKNAVIKLEKGAKPIAIGKDFIFEDSVTIKLEKADENESFDGVQVFTLPTSWTAEQVNTFFAMVDVSAFQPENGAYQVKLYNNRGKVTLEAYKISVSSDMEQPTPIGEGTYAFWADAVKAIDASSADMPVISIAGDLTLEKMEMPSKPLMIMIDGKLTLRGITKIAAKNGLYLSGKVDCYDRTGKNLSALTISGHSIMLSALNGSINAKSLTVTGDNKPDGCFISTGEITVDSISGFETIMGETDLHITRTLKTDHIDCGNTKIVVEAGAELTINKGPVCWSDYTSAEIGLSKGAKPIVIGKNYDIETSGTIKLVKAYEDENLDGQQIFTLPKSWTAEQVNAFLDKVNISDFQLVSASQPENSGYDVKLYNNKGKVTLEGYKIKVGDDTYAFWKDAIDAIDNSGAEEATITLLGDTTLTKMEMPKTAALTIDGESTLTLKGVISLSPKANLVLKVPVVCVDAKNNPAALTISTAAGKDLSLYETIDCKALTIKGSKSYQLRVFSAITADSITGFSRVVILDGSLTVNKTLTTDELTRSNEAYLVIKSGAAVTVNRRVESCVIRLEKGAKPIVIGKDCFIFSSIKLTKANATDNFDGQQIFTLPKSWTAEQVNAFLKKVDISGITSGGDAYETKLYNNKGKVTLEGYKIKVGDDTYAFWKDAIDAIDNSGAEEATITLLGKTTLTKMEMPKTAALTINGEDIRLLGVSSIKANGKLTISTLIQCYDKTGKNLAPMTITAPSLDFRHDMHYSSLTLKGSGTGASLAVNSAGFIDADSVTGFSDITVNSEKMLLILKTLTADNIIIDGGNLNLANAALTAKKSIVCKNGGFIRIVGDIKPIVIGNNFDTENSSIIFEKNDKVNMDGKQLFTVPTAKTFDYDKFIGKVNWDALKSGNYPYELAVKSGKVTLVGKPFTLSQVGDFASWADVITEINKTTGGTYTVTYKGKELINLGATFKLPKAGKCDKLTITNGKFIFTGKTVKLTCDLTLTNCTIFDKNGNERSYEKGDYTVNDGNDKYTFEIVEG